MSLILLFLDELKGYAKFFARIIITSLILGTVAIAAGTLLGIGIWKCAAAEKEKGITFSFINGIQSYELVYTLSKIDDNNKQKIILTGSLKPISAFISTNHFAAGEYRITWQISTHVGSDSFLSDQLIIIEEGCTGEVVFSPHAIGSDCKMIEVILLEGE